MTQVRPVEEKDYDAWRPLWDGYNAFYGREGTTALPEAITAATWRRFFDPTEPVFALVATDARGVLGLAHYLFHRSTTKIETVCYLQDLFTAETARGQGIGRALIQAVYARAKESGAGRVYWHTKATNATARALYERVGQHHGFIVYSHDIER
jgi:GNAT superfamily N-acetyltransferase